MYKSRIRTTFHSADPRVCAAFWLFGMCGSSGCNADISKANSARGLINNVLYVIILSSALDLVGTNIPKGVVLLADVIPSFLVKLCAPYFINAVPYPIRVILFATLSSCGMLLIALTPAYTDGGSISTKMAGVVLASLSSGGGELSFLGLTHFYGPLSLAAWGSGTGGAGLIGAGAYALATTVMGLSVKGSLLASSLLPILMLISFFIVLPRGPLRGSPRIDSKVANGAHTLSEALTDPEDPQEEQVSEGEDEGLLNSSSTYHNNSTRSPSSWKLFKTNLRRSRSLFVPLYVLSNTYPPFPPLPSTLPHDPRP